MRFQFRDGHILQAIYDNDGVLAKRHLKAMFWPGKSWRAMERRLAKLYHARYLAWPSREQHRTHPIPEPICWLGWRGALFLAGRYGVDVQQPRSENENQMRSFRKRLRDNGVRWVREPRWSLVRHDLAVVDFRLAMEWSVGQVPSLVLENWLPESVFRSDVDQVSYTIRLRNGRVVRMERGVCPDAYFEVVEEALRMVGKPHRARFLLEIDMGTHDNPSFGREKAVPGVAYVKSPVYKARFGNNSGKWLVVTAGGMRRMGNMIGQTNERVGRDAHMFFFTMLDQIGAGNLLTSPIWWQAERNEPRPLLL